MPPGLQRSKDGRPDPGRHLPVGTDWLIALGHARELSEELDAYLLPAMPYGCSVEHMQFPGTVTLRPTTLAAFLEDMVIPVYRQGFRKIVVLSTHGGNWVPKPFLRELSRSIASCMPRVCPETSVQPKPRSFRPVRRTMGQGTARPLTRRPGVVCLMGGEPTARQ